MQSGDASAQGDPSAPPDTPHATGHGPREAAVLVAILIVAAGLRFGFLSSRGWWFDEARTVETAALDLPGLLRHVLATDVHPPLYYVVVSMWSRVAGTGEAGLRSLSATLGVVAVWLAYAASARLLSVRVGLVAAALAAVNPMLVWFSLEARMYALLIVLGGWSFLSFAHALEDPRGRNLSEWVVASALALWTHYFALFLVVPEALWLLFRHPRNRALRAGLVSLVLAGAALLPFVLAAAAGNNETFMRDRGWILRIASVPCEFLLGFQPPAPIVLAPVALLTPVVAIWLLVARTDAAERRGAATAAVVAGAALAVPALVAFVPRFDLFMTRYLAGAAIPCLVVIAAGLGARRAGRTGMGVVVLTCVLGVTINLVTAHVSKFEHEDWRGASRMIPPPDVPRALVVTPARGSLPLGLYRPRLRTLTGPEATVSEIVVVALPPMSRTLGQASVPPRPPSPAPPDASFRMVERVEADSFTLVRYRTAAPVTVDPVHLAEMRLGPEKVTLLLEAPD